MRRVYLGARERHSHRLAEFWFCPQQAMWPEHFTSSPASQFPWLQKWPELGNQTILISCYNSVLSIETASSASWILRWISGPRGKVIMIDLWCLPRVRVHVLSCSSRVWLFVAPRTLTLQVPLSVRFSRQSGLEWAGVGCRAFLQGIFLSQGSLMSPVLEGGFFATRATWGAQEGRM